ncbi:MAG: hypothetical protein M3Y33_13790, partial [Actinomycetota bacterium]|nr:hypothetical protein [Actinomycetota bacterium]
LSLPSPPDGPPPAILPGTHPVRLPGTEVTYYENLAAGVLVASYFPPHSLTQYVRDPDGGFAPFPGGRQVPSPDGRWFAQQLYRHQDLRELISLAVFDRRTGRRLAVATPGFGVSPDAEPSWSDSGTRLFVTAVRDGQSIGFAYGDAPAFRMHLVLVARAGIPYDSYFVPVPDGSGMIDNIIEGTRPGDVSSGPLRFISVSGTQTAQVSGAQLPPDPATPFSPSGRLLLTLCGTGRCVLNAATRQVMARIPVLGDGGNPVYPARDAGWYDDRHFLTWIAAGSGYQLVTVSLAGVVTGILATDRSLDIPPMSLAPP